MFKKLIKSAIENDKQALTLSLSLKEPANANTEEKVAYYKTNRENYNIRI